jgi:hypothetical protein
MGRRDAEAEGASEHALDGGVVHHFAAVEALGAPDLDRERAERAVTELAMSHRLRLK